MFNCAFERLLRKRPFARVPLHVILYGRKEKLYPTEGAGMGIENEIISGLQQIHWYVEIKI